MTKYNPGNYYGMTPGSICSGTLNEARLIRVFSELAIERIPELFTADVLRPCEFESISDFEQTMNATDEQYFLFISDPELVGEFLERIFELFNAELAPPYCYFGAHQGDGSDFGFWIDYEMLFEEINTGKEVVFAKSTLDFESAPDTPIYMLETNERGNATLYRIERSFEEVWSNV